VAHLSSTSQPLFEILNKNNPSSITVIIGPEGGFEAAEIETFIKQGFTVSKLSNQVMSSELACIFFLSVCRYKYER
jgi:16S rRNA (uracil1498-N3)-methyltransferase